MSRNASPTRKESNAVKFVKGGAKKSAASVEPEPPELSLVPEDSGSVGDTAKETPKAEPKRRAKPASSAARQDLPRKELSHRVRIDIHSRIDDESYRRKKQGERTTLADIADEALHLGLLQIEKRNSQSHNS